MNERLSQFEARMQKQMGDLIKWTVGTGFAIVAIIVAILALFVNILAVAAPKAPLDTNATAAKEMPAVARILRHAPATSQAPASPPGPTP